MSVSGLFKDYSGEVDFTKINADYAVAVTTSIQGIITYYKDTAEFPDLSEKFIQNCERLNALAAQKVDKLYQANKKKMGYIASGATVAAKLGSMQTHERYFQMIDRDLGTTIRLVDTAFLKAKMPAAKM